MKKLIILISIILTIFSLNFKNYRYTLFIPLYSCPSDNSGKIWKSVLTAGKKGYKIIVVWGIICENDDYKSKLSEFKNAGIKNLAYISTNNSKKSLKKIKKMISFYKKYPIDGFFFDEIDNSKKAFNYNEKLVNIAKQHNYNMAIVFNSPNAPANFVAKTSADMVVIFENNFFSWRKFEDNYPLNLKNKSVVIIHLTSLSNFKKALYLVFKRKFNNFYITDRGYDNLPTYFKKILDILYIR